MNGLEELVAGDGRKPAADDRRRKGLKQGAFLMLLSVVLIPAYFLLAALFPPNDRVVESAVSDTPFEKISQALLVTMFLLGLVRVGYAYFFMKDDPVAIPDIENPQPALSQRKRNSARGELPAGEAIPVTGFGAWREEERSTK